MTNKLYALDFDGVICDSAVETGITGWKVASHLWQDMPMATPDKMIDLFRHVRPVMETGYEAILIMRLLFKGIDPHLLLTDFAQQIKQIIQQENLNIDQLKTLFGETRDHWIKADLADWIAMNPLFEGVADTLKSLDPSSCYIITTKQERFVHHILDANGLSVPAEQVYGLDRKLSKQQILADLSEQYPDYTILFVEDRLPTLINVLGDDRLADIKLLFADWGYNTEQDKQAVQSLAVKSIQSFNEIVL